MHICTVLFRPYDILLTRRIVHTTKDLRIFVTYLIFTAELTYGLAVAACSAACSLSVNKGRHTVICIVLCFYWYILQLRTWTWSCWTWSLTRTLSHIALADLDLDLKLLVDLDSDFAVAGLHTSLVIMPHRDRLWHNALTVVVSLLFLTLSSEWKGVAASQLAGRKPVTRVTRAATQIDDRRSRSLTRPINAVTENQQYIWNRKAFKLRTWCSELRIEYDDPHHRHER